MDISLYILKTLRDDRRPPKAFDVGGTKKGAGDARRICFRKVFGRFWSVIVLAAEQIQTFQQWKEMK